MANTLKIKRGTAATIPQGQLAEPLFTTDTYDLYIGKGSGGNQRIQNYIASGTSSQFLKGDGSLDSNTYQTALIFSSPLVNTSGTVTINQSSGTVNGYLSSTDWTTFNSKEPAITAGTTLQYYRGDKTFQTLDTSVVPENGPIYFTEPRVRATVLTGLNLSGGGTIAATDSILTAFGKVQNQISALVGGATYQGTWNASTNTPTLATGTGTKGYYYVVSVAGSTNLDGITDWKVGDWAIFNGTTWDKVDNTDAVSSVNGFTGAVNLGLGNISDVTLSSPTNTQLLRFNGTSSKWENWTPTYISGNQTITLSGDVSGSGTTTIATTIGAGKVTNAMLAGSIAASKLVGTDIATVGTITTGIWNGTTIAIADGGTGATTKAAAFNALSPMTTLGDIIYGGASGAGTRLAGNTAASKRFLIQTGDGTNSAAPSWGSIAAGDVPTLNQNTTGSAATLTTARNFTINGSAKSFDGSANVSWTAADIGLTSYLPLTGGTLTGTLNGLSATFTGSFTVGAIGLATTPANSAGWRKIGVINSRGGGRLIISLTGGNYTPVTYIIEYYKDWTNVGTLKLEKYGTQNYITDARIRQDSADNLYYIEINCASDANGLELVVYDLKILGYNSTSTIYTGALSAGSATGTTIASASFPTSESGITVLGRSVFGTIGGTWDGAVIGSSFGGAGTVSGILKANGSGTVSAAVAGTDYVIPSALSSYLPLSGGTLTGALSGTSATFSGSQGTYGMLDLYSTSANSYSILSLRGTSRGGEIDFYDGTTIGASIYGGTSSDKSLYFTTNGGSSVRLTISSTGAATFSSSVGVGGTNTDSLLTVNGTAGTSHERFREGSTTVGFVGGANGIITGHNGKLALRAESGLILSGTGNSPDVIIASGGAATFSNALQVAGQQAAANYGGTGLNFDFTTGNIGRIASVKTTSGGSQLQFIVYNTSGTDINALSISSTGAATFSSSVSVGAAIAGRLGVRGTTNDSSAYSFEAANSSGNTLFIVRNDGLSWFTGNVGIGTTSPSTALHVVSNDGSANRTNPFNVATITATSGSAPYNGFGAGLVFAATHYNGTVYNGARIRSVLNDNSVSSLGNSIAFDVTPTRGGTLTEAVRIDYNGNVGIGTTSPSAIISGTETTLNVKGNVSSAVGSIVARSFGTTNSTSIGIAAFDTINQTAIFTESNSPMGFYTNSTERMRITSGNGSGSVVLIGKTATNSYPTNTSSLQIDGAAGSLFETSYNGTKGLRIGSDATTEFFHSSRNVPINFFSNNSVNWSLQITANGQVAYTALSPSPNTSTITNTTTATPVLNSSDTYIYIGNSTSAYTLTIANPNGTPTQGQKLLLRFKDNGTQVMGISFGTQFRASSDLALPTTTTAGKTLYCGFIYNSTDTKWDMVALLNNF